MLAALPRQDRELLLLFAWAELSYAEAAAALGTTAGAVKGPAAPDQGADAAGTGR